MEMLAGWRAVSLAGNDKGRVYVIKEDCGEYVFLSDENGKIQRKNKKHIQVIKNKANRHIGGNEKICLRQM